MTWGNLVLSESLPFGMIEQLDVGIIGLRSVRADLKPIAAAHVRSYPHSVFVFSVLQGSGSVVRAR